MFKIVSPLSALKRNTKQRRKGEMGMCVPKK